MSIILPSGIAVSEAFGDLPHAYLLPEEEDAIRFAAAGRRREFTIARTCARLSLLKLGYVPFPIPMGLHREPIWPSGIVGSITHCKDYTAAALARSDSFAAIGVDAEEHEKLPFGVLELIACDEDRIELENLPQDGQCWDKLMFSAKESIFKAWYPFTHQWLDFKDVAVMIEPECRLFSTSISSQSEVIEGQALRQFKGSYQICGDLILTAVVLEPSRRRETMSRVHLPGDLP